MKVTMTIPASTPETTFEGAIKSNGAPDVQQGLAVFAINAEAIRTTAPTLFAALEVNDKEAKIPITEVLLLLRDHSLENQSHAKSYEQVQRIASYYRVDLIQTRDEVHCTLDALETLHKRAIRKRRRRVAAAYSKAMSIVAGLFTFDGNAAQLDDGDDADQEFDGAVPMSASCCDGDSPCGGKKKKKV